MMSAPVTSTTFDPTTLESAAQASGGATGISAGDMLQMVFGQTALNPLSLFTNPAGDGTILSLIFMYLNVGLLTLGSIYLSYKTLAAATQTAHDGEFIGKAFHTVWVPIRVTTGIMSLLPIAGGWNALQIVMLWVGLLGAGLGNMTWEVVVNEWSSGRATQAATQQNAPDGDSIKDGETIFKIVLCDTAKTLNGNPAGAWQGSALGGTYYDSPGCGVIKIKDSPKPQTSTPGNGNLQQQINAIALSETRSLVVALKEQALTYVTLEKEALATAGTGKGPDAIVSPIPMLIAVKSAINAYGVALKQKTNAVAAADPAVTDGIMSIMKASAKEYGFTSAGSFYSVFAGAQAKINAAVDIAGLASASFTLDLGSPDITPSFLPTLYLRIEQADKVNNADQTKNGDPGTADGAFAMLKEHIGLSYGESIINYFIGPNATSGSGSDPTLIGLKNTADKMVYLGAGGLTAVGVVQGLKDGAEDVPLVGKFAKAATGAVTPWLEMAKTVFEISMAFFLMMSIYLPLVPYIVFIGQVLEWLVSVIIGVCAAPFLAFAHFDTDGEGLGQRTQYGYTFMLSSFIRPIMLILSFVFASAVIEVAISFLSKTYMFAVADAQANSMTGLFSVIGLIALYLILAVGLINTACSLMWILPDAILKFMGADGGNLGFSKDLTTHTLGAVGGGTAIVRAGTKKRDKDQQPRRTSEPEKKEPVGSIS